MKQSIWKAITDDFPTGNCFFAAISDQLYGNDSYTSKYRAMAVKYILERKDHFMPFTTVKRGGGTREVAKRKNAGGYSVSVDHGPASTSAIEIQFKARMAEMARDGTYVDQQEIWAMAAVLGINIRIFEPASTRDTDEAAGNGKPVAAIAYDPIAQHYSSVRRIGDSRTGPANVEGRYNAVDITKSIKGQSHVASSTQSPTQSPTRLSLMANDLLHAEQWARSRSSTPGSISVQREHEEDIEPSNPPKRSMSDRKIRSASSRKPSKLSKKISAAPTPPTLASRPPSPEATIIVGEVEPEPLAAASPPSQRGATTLPSPPNSLANSPYVVIISSDEEEDTPLSPRKIAQRRRSSKKEEWKKETSASSAENISAGETKPARKIRGGRIAKAKDDSALPAPKAASTSRRRLRRGIRDRKETPVDNQD